MRFTIRRFISLPLVGCIAVCWAAGDLSSHVGPVNKTQGYVPFSEAPISYRSPKLSDLIAKLQGRIDDGSLSLQYDRRFGYLPSILRALAVPVSSQTLVFSKTSFQAPQISPAAPRALYFNDDVYVGRVQQGKFLEFVSFDPDQGAIFYILDERRTRKPVFERAEVDCVQCHVAPSTRGVPGVMLRSVLTSTSGYQAASKPSFVTGHESPVSERWGGWYVTAASGPTSHMGNTAVPVNSPASQPIASHSLNTLPDLVNSHQYLTASSDIVALMVLAHQTQMHNLITEANYRTRQILFSEEAKTKAAGEHRPQLSEAAQKQIEEIGERVVRYLLFTNEAALPSPIAGDSSFARDFSQRGPRDPNGRSLRDFDLKTRIFKYPCSYLIYSEDFDAIPQPAKDFIYGRLFEVLSGADSSPEFASLSQEDRHAILEILQATKPGLPAEWKHFAERPVAIQLLDQPQSTERKSNAN